MRDSEETKAACGIRMLLMLTMSGESQQCNEIMLIVQIFFAASLKMYVNYLHFRICNCFAARSIFKVFREVIVLYDVTKALYHCKK